MISEISRETIFLMVVIPQYPTSHFMLTLLSSPAAQEPWRKSGTWCLMNLHYCCDMSMTRDLCNYSLLTCLYNWLWKLPVPPSENPVCLNITKKPSLNLAYRGYAAHQEKDLQPWDKKAERAEGRERRWLYRGENTLSTVWAWHFPSGRAGDMYEDNEKMLGKERVLVSAAS